jgi:hypothetical protein
LAKDSPGHAKRRLRALDTKNSLSKPSIVRWNHLPHEALSLEIDARIVRREPSEADAEVTREHLRGLLKLLEPTDHEAYVNRVAADLKRELRICRDVYRDILSPYSASWGVAAKITKSSVNRMKSIS